MGSLLKGGDAKWRKGSGFRANSVQEEEEVVPLPSIGVKSRARSMTLLNLEAD